MTRRYHKVDWSKYEKPIPRSVMPIARIVVLSAPERCFRVPANFMTFLKDRPNFRTFVANARHDGQFLHIGDTKPPSLPSRKAPIL